MRVIKRAKLNRITKVRNISISLFLSVLMITIFLLLLGQNPIEIYPAMFMAIFGSSFRLLTLTRYIVPLTIVSLGISVAFKLRFWNIGGEGQMIMGAIFASYFALFFDNWPSWLLLSVMMIAAIIGGGLYGLLAGVIKVYFDTNETIVTLMLNYIALQFLTYLQYVAWKNGNFPVIASFGEAAVLPKINGISTSIFVALLVVIFSYLLLNKSRIGFEIAVTGESEQTAKYVGIEIKKLTLLIMFISGGIIGLAGFAQVAGNLKTLSVGVTLGVGFTGVVIAWISKLEVKRIVWVSILFAILLQATGALDSLFHIPSYSVDVMQAIVLFFVLGSDFFNEYQIVKGG